jgi:fructose/tagatose bisphosphate aldolase
MPEALDDLVRRAAFDPDPTDPRREIRERALREGAFPASIQGLYDAIAAGRVSGFTVPAFNLRGLVYDCARAIFRAAKALDAGAFVFEISRGEMAYTDLVPAEFSAGVLAAAVREGWRGPVFLQGDHVQFDRARPLGEERTALEALVRAELDAGFYNIDIDASTLVVLERPTIGEQQRENSQLTSEMTAFIRRHQTVEVSVGGEIGEVGHKNSTVEEFEAFFEGCRFAGRPISKVSIQAGTEHGGTVLADGSRARPAVDFEAHRRISAAARRRGLAGTVQHGASTLPEEMLAEFPATGCVEIHLATEFQRAIFNHPRFPEELRRRQDAWLAERGLASPQDRERNIKRTWGPLKRPISDLPENVRIGIMNDMERRYGAVMGRLGVAGTRRLVEGQVKP